MHSLLEIYAEDWLWNAVLDNETFHVDAQPPLIEKEVGEPKIPLMIELPTGQLASSGDL